METQEECNLLAELILRKKLKNITEYRAAVAPISGRGSKREGKEIKEKKKRERKSDTVVSSVNKKPKKMEIKNEEAVPVESEFPMKDIKSDQVDVIVDEILDNRKRIQESMT